MWWRRWTWCSTATRVLPATLLSASTNPARGGAGRAGALSRAWASLCREASQDATCRSLEAAVQRLHENAGAADLLAGEFGQRVDNSESSGLQLLATANWPSALLTWCWPQAVTRGAVPLVLVLSDYLRQALGRSPAGLAEAVEEMWQRGEFLAAQKAAEADETLAQLLAQRFEGQRAAFRQANAGLLEDIAAHRENDSDLAECLQEVERCLGELRFVEAQEWLPELDRLLQQVKVRCDPGETAEPSG
jgi:hypothetical protein